MKILIIKPSSLGDVIHALPVLRLLKAHFPHSQIYWWIAADFAPLLQDDPDLSGVILFERKRWSYPWHWPEMLRAIQQLRAHRFDWVVDLQGLSRSAWFAWLANGDNVVGLDNPREGNREGAQMFYNILAPRSPNGTPAPERYLSVLSVLGAPVHWNFEWLPSRPVESATVRAQAASLPGRIIALVPGARWDNKRWPVEYFAKTIQKLAGEDASLNFVIIGAKSDRSLAETIIRAHPEHCRDLTGRTTLLEMIEWLRLADLVITNDTGPMHVAAALGRPLLALFGPSDPFATGPHRQLDNVLRARHLPCVPCMKSTCAYQDPLACLRGITPTEVLQVALQLLADPSQRNAPVRRDP